MRSTSWCLVAIAAALVLAVAPGVRAHCQVPCGIYDDELRIQLIEEHATTIEKSMRMIRELGAAEAPEWNQLVRWVDTKEQHAQKVQDLVTAYFMAQRVKPPATTEGEAWDEYVLRLTLLHKMQVAAMKAKQTTEPAHVATLRTLIADFRKAYFGEEAGHHH